MINVLIIEDSKSAADLLRHVMESDPALRVVGMARNGLEGLRMATTLRPDLVTMDIEMPVMDGFEATRRLMEESPVPVVVVSSFWDPAEVQKTFRAMQAGAVAIMRKPFGIGHPEHEASAKALIDTIKLMSEVRVVRRKPRRPAARPQAASPETGPSCPPEAQPGFTGPAPRLIVIGASTGGPPVLQRILSGLRPDFPLPVLVVQHIAAGFVSGLVEWLNSSSAIPVRLAMDGEDIVGGRAYFAPDGGHFGVSREMRAVISASGPVHGVRPAVDHLFRSAAQATGRRTVAILLTGMGVDGAEALKVIHDLGGLTLAQDRESCVVFGMPGEAVRLGAAEREMSPDGIIQFLNSLPGSVI